MKKRPNKNEKDPEYVLVYSTDPTPAKRCTACNRPLEGCVCSRPAFSGALNPAVRLERKGRGGKVVTVVHKLPAQAKLLKELCVFLKRSVGGGGTHYVVDGEGIIEIQGDLTDVILSLIGDFNKPKP